MTPERWRHIEDLYHAALERRPEVRAAFLSEDCREDAELRQEVESLLAQESSQEGMLDQPAWVGASSDSDRIGHYRITGKLGEGGMGEVYRAIDTKLGRDVAIKVIPEIFARDPDRMSRFKKEAQVLASLNHPNIAAIYGVEDRALVMELVEGPTLAEGVKRGAIPLEDALPIVRQITDALEYAHERGVIHRDLKPANIKVTPEGRVKVLDFGLAKVLANETASGDPEQSPTLSALPTQAGVILGTAAYMAPEQARGEKVDKRADIWSFGVVVYEMLTGQKLFAGPTVSDTLAAVLKEQPKFDKVPLRAQRLLRRCIEKDPKKRLRDIGDVWQLLEAEPAPNGGESSPQSWIGWAVVAGLILALTGGSFMYFHEKAPESTPITFIVLPPANTVFLTGLPNLAVSPDGKRLVFAAASDGKIQLWVRPFNSTSAAPLPGTEDASFPFWSPDSKSLGFFASAKLKRIDLAGGEARTLAEGVVPRGGTWNEDGVILFGNLGKGLFRVAAVGGDVGAVTRIEANSGVFSHQHPWFLPGGKHFLYAAHKPGTNQATIRIGSLDSPAEDHVLLPDANSPARYAQGHLVFMQGATLKARPFDATKLAFTGEAVTVAEKVQGSSGVGLNGAFSISSNGWLVYAGEAEAQLTWFDRAGKQLDVLGDPGNISDMAFSPDRKHVAVTMSMDANNDIWVYDVQHGSRERFTDDPAVDDNPVWSPDGHTIVFMSHRNLYRKAVDGFGVRQLLYGDSLGKYPASFSWDGKYLAYYAVGSTSRDIWILPDPLKPAVVPKPYALVRSKSDEDPRFSPDGKWIAYQSNESSQRGIYVSAFPSGAKKLVSNAGRWPRWRQDGKELFYIAPGKRMMAAPIDAKHGSLEVGKIELLFSGPIAGRYDVDGQRFLAIVQSQQLLTVVQNWTAGLKK